MAEAEPGEYIVGYSKEERSSQMVHSYSSRFSVHGIFGRARRLGWTYRGATWVRVLRCACACVCAWASARVRLSLLVSHVVPRPPGPLALSEGAREGR